MRTRMINMTSVTIEQFLAIEDEDLKRFIYIKQMIVGKSESIYINNEEKIGFYHRYCRIKKGVYGNFYKHSLLMEWIVYNKKTKKISISSKLDNVRSIFFRKYFRYEHIISAMGVSLTGIFCKKVIQGKIETLRDVIKYIKSYQIRRPDLSDEVVYNFIIAGNIRALKSITDPENAENISNIRALNHLECASGIKVKCKDIHQLNNKFNEWCTEQSKKLDTFNRSRNAEVGDPASKELF